MHHNLTINKDNLQCIYRAHFPLRLHYQFRTSPQRYAKQKHWGLLKQEFLKAGVPPITQLTVSKYNYQIHTCRLLVVWSGRCISGVLWTSRLSTQQQWTTENLFCSMFSATTGRPITGRRWKTHSPTSSLAIWWFDAADSISEVTLHLLLLSCAKSHMLSASRRQPRLLHVSAVDRRQTWSMAKSWRCVTLSGFLHSHIVRCRWNPISCGTHYSGPGLSENSTLRRGYCQLHCLQVEMQPAASEVKSDFRPSLWSQ